VSPQSSRTTLQELRIGLRPAFGGAGSYIALFDSDTLGRFSFEAPPAGSYTVAVLDPEYAGELSFDTDGRTTLPGILSITVRPK